MTTRVLASPGTYIQGPGELSRICDHISRLGGPFLFVMGGFAFSHLRETIEESFRGSGIPVVCEKFSGECTKAEIFRLQLISQEHGCRAVIGVGGGKALDSAKGVAYYAGIPVICVPTIASTDAPTSAIAVTYTDDHVFDGNILLPKNPEIVLVDTAIISQAPVRFLVAGMGDALSTFFEARANAESDHDNFAGGKSTRTSYALARLCYDILIRDGLRAKESAMQQVISRELEDIIEANIYLSGIGFESSGLACAHSIYNSLTVLPGCRHMHHGELVAFGTLVQLMLEKRPHEEVDEVIRFCIRVGLPVSFSGISSCELSAEDLQVIAANACDPGSFMASEPFAVTPAMVVDALTAADALGSRYLAEIPAPPC